MNSIAIITARGGSKRIPRKNIKDFCGKPILAYSIMASLTSQLFDEVMVSTDSEEIASIARSFGAKVPFFRSNKNSDDYATTEDVLEEVIENYADNGISFKWFACVYPTAPFVTAEKMKSAYKIFSKSNAATLEAVVRFSYPPQRGYVEQNGLMVYKWKEYVNSRSQDLETFYHDAGQFYFFDKEKFMDFRNTGSVLTKKPYILDEAEVQDIDNLDDWYLAELKYKLMIEKSDKNV